MFYFVAITSILSICSWVRYKIIPAHCLSFDCKWLLLNVAFYNSFRPQHLHKATQTLTSFPLVEPLMGSFSSSEITSWDLKFLHQHLHIISLYSPHSSLPLHPYKSLLLCLQCCLYPYQTNLQTSSLFIHLSPQSRQTPLTVHQSSLQFRLSLLYLLNPKTSLHFMRTRQCTSRKGYICRACRAWPARIVDWRVVPCGVS